jgi:general secretion pathway protein J
VSVRITRPAAPVRFANAAVRRAARRRSSGARSAHRPQRGFTLLELVIALTLFALMSGVLYGALGYAGRSWEGGEAKAEATSSMRLAHEFLRAQIEGQHPLRMRRMTEYPLLFAGTRDELRYAAPLPARITGGGIWYYRLSLAKEGNRGRLVLEREVPDLDAAALPEFGKSDRSVLADDIGELRLSYFGRDTGAPFTATPTWRERWDDRSRLPLLIRIDVVPVRGAPWPTLLVAPRQGPESGCRQWDIATERCMGMS